MSFEEHLCKKKKKKKKFKDINSKQVYIPASVELIIKFGKKKKKNVYWP